MSRALCVWLAAGVVAWVLLAADAIGQEGTMLTPDERATLTEARDGIVSVRDSATLDPEDHDRLDIAQALVDEVLADNPPPPPPVGIDALFCDPMDLWATNLVAAMNEDLAFYGLASLTVVPDSECDPGPDTDLLIVGPSPFGRTVGHTLSTATHPTLDLIYAAETRGYTSTKVIVHTGTQPWDVLPGWAATPGPLVANVPPYDPRYALTMTSNLAAGSRVLVAHAAGQPTAVAAAWDTDHGTHIWAGFHNRTNGLSADGRQLLADLITEAVT